MTISQIADEFRNGVVDHGTLEKTLYFRAQRRCLAASERGSESADLLTEAARLAERLGTALEPDAIDAYDSLLWVRYANDLEKLIRAASEPEAITPDQIAALIATLERATSLQ